MKGLESVCFKKLRKSYAISNRAHESFKDMLLADVAVSTEFQGCLSL